MRALRVLQDGLSLGMRICAEGDIVPEGDVPENTFQAILKKIERGYPHVELIEVADDMALVSSLPDEEETGVKGPHLVKHVRSGRKVWVDAKGRFICGSPRKDGLPCEWVVPEPGGSCRHPSHKKS